MNMQNSRAVLRMDIGFLDIYIYGLDNSMAPTEALLQNPFAPGLPQILTALSIGRAGALGRTYEGTSGQHRFAL